MKKRKFERKDEPSMAAQGMMARREKTKTIVAGW
jgi:hypothetical protein